MRAAVELLIRNATVVTMNASREVLRDADVLIDGDRIASVGPHSKARRPHAHRVIDGLEQAGFGSAQLHRPAGSIPPDATNGT